MNCPEPEIISAFADGELETKEAADVERHVAQCARCRESLEEMQWLERRGRAALEAIPVEETAIQKVVYLKPFWRRWARPVPLVAAAAVAAILVGMSLAFFHLGGRETASLTLEPVSNNNRSISSEASNSPDESEDAAFAQWLEPYRNLNIPLVSMETAANYDPAPIPPARPESVERN